MRDSLKYPIGLESFEKIIELGFVYIDKTSYIQKLLEQPKHYFLSRPRRFGKSLLLSTLQAYFEGRRELFKGLAIDDDEMDWTPRPVFKLSLNSIIPNSEDAIDNVLSSIFMSYEKVFGKLDGITDLSQRLRNLIVNAHEQTGRKVVVLVDEYDSPLLSTLDRPELNEYYRQTLRGVFSVLKSADAHIHLAFITGVSRFSQTSLFSGANNLSDISFDSRYAGVCGITEEELKSRLWTGICDLAEKLRITEEEAFARLKESYDGYHFCEESPDIYNPFSLLSALDARKIRDYWFQSGTPSYLLRVLNRDNFFLPDLDRIEAVESALSPKESYLNNPVALLFETGYITIQSYDDERDVYTLGLPNKEVAESFSKALKDINLIPGKSIK